jgi:N-acetylmuramoyl-L-alanine amidase
MSLKRNRNQGTSTGTAGGSKNQNATKKVVDIILSPNHQAYNSPEDIGTIFFVEVGFNQDYSNSTSLPSAKPLNRNNFTYPTIGELVQIVESTSNNIYNDLEGDISATTNYYTPAINVHNNTASNALPLEKDTKKSQPKTEPNVKAFEFKKEFKSQSRETARKNLNNYLRSLGYSSGANDPKAPKYNLTQAANGDYVFRLDSSEDNEQIAVQLGNYFKENPELQPLTPSEGDSIMEGKNGQRIRFTTTGPTGTNAISNNVTDAPDDGNPSIGDKAMVLSLGNGSQENVTNDAASIYMLENQSIPIDATSTKVDSLNSNYTPVSKPLEEISKPPVAAIPKATPQQELQIQEIQFDFSNIPVKETTPIQPIPETSDPIDDDPVFAALDEAQDEGLLVFNEESIEVAGTELDSTTDNQPEVSFPNPSVQEDLQPDEVPTQADYKQVNIDAEKEWKGGKKATFKNKAGALLVLPQPDRSLAMVKTNRRIIKYLVIHTAGSSTSTTPASLMRFFFNERDGSGWKTGGYHWIVDRNGNGTRVYSDDVSTNGASGINSNSIHLNWIGGYSGPGEPLNFNITRGQINTLKRLTRKYVELYPNIKVLGHNQCSNKPCPLFNVPEWCDKINISTGNILRGTLSTGKGFYAQWDGSDLVNESNRLANLVT